MAIQPYDHRKSKIQLHITNADGTPAALKQVTAAQTKHQFLFGVGAFDAVPYANGEADEAQREQLHDRLKKMFTLNNFGTLPFYLGRFEPEEGKPDTARLQAAARYLKGRGIQVKGHPLCWHTVCAPWLMKYSNEVILEKQLERIRREVGGFKGIIDMWDVINEVVIMPIFDKYDNAVTRIAKTLGRAGLVKKVFAAAREANPNAILLINDFNTSIDYEILVDGCLQAGIEIDAIGIQSHQHQGYWGREKIVKVLERFAHFGKPLHFTENTLISGDLMPAHIEDLNDWQVESWPTTPQGEARQAHEIVEMYETLFAHPAVTAITTWDAVDGKWLKAPSGLLRADNSPKPAYEALMQKVKGEWWTKTSIVTDENGDAELEGFRGEYELHCQGKRASFTLDEKSARREITLADA